MALRQATPNETTFTKYARGEVKFDQYIESLRSQLWDQGGGWVTVAPRDTAQQGNDSESAGITSLSRRNAEMWAEKAGCVGYEIGGAQYQAGLIRGFDPAKYGCCWEQEGRLFGLQTHQPHGGRSWSGPDPKGGGGTPPPLYGPQNCRTEQGALSAPEAPEILF